MSTLPESTSEEPTSDVTANTTITTNTTSTNTNDNTDYEQLDDLDLPPLRIHATRVKDRLSASSLQIPPGGASASASSSLHKRHSFGSTTSSGSGHRRPRSRSRSPSWHSSKDRAATATTFMDDRNSSFSSLEEFVDPDILYDKLGTLELTADTSKPQPKPPQNLTPVSERMSEDTLEDVHAFSDISCNTNTRSQNSVTGEAGSHVLEVLDEIDEIDDVDLSDHNVNTATSVDPDVSPAAEEGPQVVTIVNLENIEEHNADDTAASGVVAVPSTIEPE